MKRVMYTNINKVAGGSRQREQQMYLMFDSDFTVAGGLTPLLHYTYTLILYVLLELRHSSQNFAVTNKLIKKEVSEEFKSACKLFL